MEAESVLIVCDPPARLHSQEVPSTNTVAIAVLEPFNGSCAEVQQYILALCQLSVLGKGNHQLDKDRSDGEIQSVSMDQHESAGLIKVTFFDARLAYKCQQWLQQDPRFNVVLDFKGGSNRSVVIPFTNSLSIDKVVDRFSVFGDIEKIWLNPDKSLTIDFYDARAVLRVAAGL